MRKVDCQTCKYYTKKKGTWHIVYPGFRPVIRQMYPKNYCNRCKKYCTDIKDCKYMDKITRENLEAIADFPNLGMMDVALDKYAIKPTRAHSADAGLDLYSPIKITVPAKGSVVIDTGVHMAIPNGMVGMLKSKSGLNVNHGLCGEGVIDAGYTGSIKIKLYNYSSIPYTILEGDKVSQLVILPIVTPQINIVETLDKTDRGDNGFGSTGK